MDTPMDLIRPRNPGQASKCQELKRPETENGHEKDQQLTAENVMYNCGAKPSYLLCDYDYI